MTLGLLGKPAEMYHLMVHIFKVHPPIHGFFPQEEMQAGVMRGTQTIYLQAGVCLNMIMSGLENPSI